MSLFCRSELAREQCSIREQARSYRNQEVTGTSLALLHSRQLSRKVDRMPHGGVSSPLEEGEGQGGGIDKQRLSGASECVVDFRTPQGTSQLLTSSTSVSESVPAACFKVSRLMM